MSGFLEKATVKGGNARISRIAPSPNGNMTLLDALGRSIQEAGDRFKAMPESERPAKVMVAVEQSDAATGTVLHPTSGRHKAGRPNTQGAAGRS